MAMKNYVLATTDGVCSGELLGIHEHTRCAVDSILTPIVELQVMDSAIGGPVCLHHNLGKNRRYESTKAKKVMLKKTGAESMGGGAAKSD
jgi:hypothetical protein